MGLPAIEDHQLPDSTITESVQQHPCETCGEVFRSKVALRRHETYVCHNDNVVFRHQRLNNSTSTTSSTSSLLHGQGAALGHTPQGLDATPGHPRHSQEGNVGHIQHELNLEHLRASQEAAYLGRSREESAGHARLIEEGRRELDRISRDSPDLNNQDSSIDLTYIDTHRTQQERRGEMIHEDNKQERQFDNSLERFPCEYCERVFSDGVDLQTHLRQVHHSARAHPCTECGKTFATSSGLKQHQHIHSSIKPFQCEVCLRAYTQFSNLCRHKRMHADCRQQIKCKDCGQAFSTTTSLSKHKRFCEGVLRSGARFGFTGASPPSSDNTATPLTPTASQASPLMAAYMNMNMYSSRPPFPFYPPLAPGFPMFPTGHPLATMPPVLPDSTKYPSLGAQLSPSSADGSPIERREKKRGDSEFSEHLSDMSELSGAGSDMEGGMSDGEDLSLERRHRTPPSMPVFPGEAPPGFDDKPRQAPAAHEKPFDLTRPSEPKPVKKPSSDGSSGGEQPLDLSFKSPKEEITPEETPRKTHIFGLKQSPPSPRAPSPPEKKSIHSAYPLTSSLMMERMYGMDKDKLQTFQEAARMMHSLPPRFPLPAPTFNPMAGMGLLTTSPMLSASKLSPLMKLERSTGPFPYSHPTMVGGKHKDRYACKFCGKVFPRSANLTRHLRTHTGEQPYKCKYCERSFSISSNLQRHVRNIHNKEKPFKCPLCDRCFGQQTNLDRHLKKHETDGPNVVDSPENDPPIICGPEDGDLGKATSPYMDEISRYSAGKEDSSLNGGLSPKHDEMIDTNFSITAQLGKQGHLVSALDKRNGEHNMDSHPLDYASEADDEGGADEDERPHKKPHLENNNLEDSSAEKSISELANGFLGRNHELFATYMSNYSHKALTCST